MVGLNASVRYWARRTPERDALIYGDTRIRYGELAHRVAQLAQVLRERGLGRGTVVALLMKNSAAFIELSLAIGACGAVLLPINYRLGQDEVAYILDHAQARLLVVDAELTQLAGAFATRMVVTAEAQHDARRLQPSPFAIAPCEPAGDAAGDLFRLMYTSGTTDRPKGVMHSYDNFAWKCLDHITALGLSSEDRLLVVGPLYHVGAFDLPGMAVLMCGGCLCILRDFTEDAVLQAIAHERLTGAWLAPVMLSRLLAWPQPDPYDLSSMRWVIGGGERTPEQRIRDFTALFGQARYIDAYGLTESCSGDTLMEPGYELQKIGSTGRALAHVDLAILDELGSPLAAGLAGEVCLRGPKVTAGYWRDAAKTQASFHRDWFRTGDIGYLDEDGFLFLTDRKKDMIISGGENIASSEVERVLYQMPQVAEAAAIGLPDAQWGECVTAVVVLRAHAQLDLSQLQQFCEGKLGGFKTPKRLYAVPELPRNASGKVLKRVLRDALAAGTPAGSSTTAMLQGALHASAS